MKQVLRNILLLQGCIALFVSVIVVITPFYDNWPSVTAGAGIALISSLPAAFAVRRMPDVIKSKDFLLVMVICEVAKWLLATVVTIGFLNWFSTPGMVAGFIVTYLGGYAGCFLIK